jgi:hypothetical protein
MFCGRLNEIASPASRDRNDGAMKHGTRNAKHKNWN